MLTAKPLPRIKCPRCKVAMVVTDILFVSDYTIVIEGTCPQCGAGLTSNSDDGTRIGVLELFPGDDKKGN